MDCYLFLLTEGGLDYHWESCLKGYNQENKVRVSANYKAFHCIANHGFQFGESIAAFCLSLSHVDCPHSDTPPIPPVVRNTSCLTAVGLMGRRVRRSWRGALARNSRCRCSSLICWRHQPTPRTCCCSRISPAGMSLSGEIVRCS